MEYPIASIGGCRGDLSDIACKKHNIRIVPMMSNEFVDFLASLSPQEDPKKKFEEIGSEANERPGFGADIDHDLWQMLIPINIEKSLSDSIVHEFVLAMKIAFPTDVYLRAIYHGNLIEGELHLGGTSYFERQFRFNIENIRQDYFETDGIDTSELNEFITQFLDNSKKDTGLIRAIQFYQSSFQINDDLMSLLAIIIALEVIVPDGEQLTYRFRRNHGILIGRDKNEVVRIMANAKLLYDYRSSIVHASQIKGNHETFESYYRYARNLAARMIIEMLVHKFENIRELDSEINLSGAGTLPKPDDYNHFFGANKYWEEFYAAELLKAK